MVGRGEEGGSFGEEEEERRGLWEVVGGVWRGEEEGHREEEMREK